MQKLVTIYLDSQVYAEGKWLKWSFPERHGSVEEHLRAELDDGWRIVSVSGFGGTTDSKTRGWLAVVLEK